MQIWASGSRESGARSGAVCIIIQGESGERNKHKYACVYKKDYWNDQLETNKKPPWLGGSVGWTVVLQTKRLQVRLTVRHMPRMWV